MENKCLVTKLKGEVNSSELPLYDVFKFQVSPLDGTASAQTHSLGLKVNEPTEIVINGDIGEMWTGNYSGDGEHVKSMIIPVSDSRTQINFVNAESTYEVHVLGAHAITEIYRTSYSSSSSISASNLIFYFDTPLPNLELLQIRDLAKSPRLTGSFDVFKNSKLSGEVGIMAAHSYLDAGGSYGNNMTGPLSSLTNNVGITSLMINGLNKKGIGSFADLSNLINLTALGIGRMGISGTIEDFVYGQIEKGRTVNNDGVTLRCVIGLYTFFGYKHSTIDLSAVLWWDDHKIWYITGGSGTGGMVVAHNATEEEIAEWEQAGKTVIQVPQET